MRIGDVRIDGKTVLAPMFLVSDLPYRILARRNGAALAYSEMVNSLAIERGNKAAMRMAATDRKEESPVALQLVGQKPDSMAKAAEMIEENADIIDINFGCPSADVLRIGAGAALLARPKRIGEIIKRVKDSVSVPVTAKMRIGIRNCKTNLERSIRIAKIIEKNGASAIAVHPRTVSQGYGGKADWSYIKAIKEEVGIPVIGNGDVRSEEDAKAMLDETGCDLVMVGRAAMGDPFIFGRIEYYLKTGKKKETKDKERQKAFIDYVSLAKRYGSDSLQRIKTHGLWMTKGLPDSARLRERISQAKDADGILELMRGA